MKNAFIINGAFGNPGENWFPWLREELESLGYKVSVPTFPTPEDQNYDSWMKVVESYLKEFNEDTVLVGHSIGATFALSILEKLDARVAKTILASGFVGKNERELDAINKTIAERDFDWETIKNHSESFSVLHGDDDPYVAMEKPEELGRLLGVEPIIIPQGGHLNKDTGFTKFPQLLEIVKDKI